jgi:hypothetical protein
MVCGGAEAQARRKSEARRDFRFRIFTLPGEIIMGGPAPRISIPVDGNTLPEMYTRRNVMQYAIIITRTDSSDRHEKLQKGLANYAYIEYFVCTNHKAAHRDEKPASRWLVAAIDLSNAA